MANSNKTTATVKNPLEFIDEWVESEEKRRDSLQLIDIMKKITGHPPKMWGPTMIGFGARHYTSAAGREGDWFAVGFSPRKAAISLYITMDATRHPELMEKLGKHTTGKGCIYIKKLSDINVDILEKLIFLGYEEAKNQGN